ncbi:nitrogenase component 1 [Acetobacterium carbinolicum]|uniref:nitrogenase component 1 n=1 Tax=Acetobacterium carbinolicum TaxID=52690 RepID=UPI0039BFE4DA
MRLNRLSEINHNKDIYGASAAISCGVFCPTFGVAVAAPLIREAAVLVVGTAECTWYARNSCIYHSEEPGYERFFAGVFEDTDIIFGSRDGILTALLQIAKDPRIRFIFLVSTCIPEIIGEDLEAIGQAAEKECGIPILPIHVAHYDRNCNEFGVAVSQTMKAMVRLMKPQTVKPGTVNLLGRNFHAGIEGSLKDSELLGLLTQNGITLHLIIPEPCNIEALQSAPAAALNIVTSEVGRELAMAMEDQFGTPYVFFEPSFELDKIRSGYQQLAGHLGISIQKIIEKAHQTTVLQLQEARQVLAGKSFVNGGRPPDAFEAAAFLTSLGMVPLLINAYRLTDNSQEQIDRILNQGWDPYVNYVANPNAAVSLMPELLPDLYIGFGQADYLKQLGILHLERLVPPGKIGYEAITWALAAVKSVLAGGAPNVSF